MITNKFFGDKSLGTYKMCMVELNGTLKKIKMIDNHFSKTELRKLYKFTHSMVKIYV